jgi:small GTP-binding protein
LEAEPRDEEISRKGVEDRVRRLVEDLRGREEKSKMSMQEAKRRIAEALNTNATELRLTNLNLTSLPNNIGSLTHLTTLDLKNNKLTSLPESIANLTNLTTLRIRSNNLNALPDCIQNLTRLTTLEAWSNRFTTCPDWIGNLTNLTLLNISYNKLKFLPESIRNLTSLTTLDISDNLFTILPEGIIGLYNIKILDASYNQIKLLPSNIGNLTNLTALDVSVNQLTSLPESIGNLTNLTILDVVSNNLTTLPEGIGKLKNLTKLDLWNNPLTEMPPEVVRQGEKGILSYLRSLARDAKSHWVSKMLIVGQGGVGKTNILRRLKGEPFNEKQNTTHGIEIRELELEHPTEPNTTMTLNVWDFAGQEINHATHQFFLANRSLYILAWNARHDWEQGKIAYWLETITARAGSEVPILVVATHTDQRIARIPTAELMRQFPQIRGFYSVSNSTGEGFEELTEAIRRESATLPLMGEKISTRWEKAMLVIRTLPDSEKHLSLMRFQSYLKTHKVEEQERDTLTQWMHDLGYILHFKDHDELRDLVILKPQWVTEHIARVLNDTDVQQRCGVFTRAEMHTVWSDVDNTLHNHFLMLMEQFDLSYRIPDDPDHKSIVVECVPWEEPAYAEKWAAMQEEQEVTMRFRLDMTRLPAGIPTWTIARQHRFSWDLHWRLGALFRESKEERANLALLQASGNTVSLTVRGALPHSFFSLMRDGFEYTLRRFKGVTVTRLIPCRCSEGCTHEFDFDSLVDRLRKRIETAECGKSYKPVPVSLLLYGLVPSSMDTRLKEMEERLLAAGQENTTEILGAIVSLIPRVQREFVAAYGELQRLEETHCPNVFLLKDKGAKGLAKLFNRPIELHLCCQYPGEWHTVGTPYTIPQGQEWVQSLAPHIKNALKILKYLSLVKPSLKEFHKEWYDLVETHVDFAESVLKHLKENPVPELFDHREIGSDQDYWQTETPEGMPTPIEGADLRRLRELLQRLDPKVQWRDWLEKVHTPEGHYLWLCPTHAAKIKPPPMPKIEP